MASKRVTLSTAAQTLFATPKHQTGKVTAINVDNQSASAAKLIFQDIFTPDASVGTTSPTEQTVVRLQVTVAAGQSLSVDKNSVDDLRILGTAKMLGDAIATTCVIVVNYHFE